MREMQRMGVGEMAQMLESIHCPSKGQGLVPSTNLGQLLTPINNSVLKESNQGPLSLFRLMLNTRAEVDK